MRGWHQGIYAATKTASASLFYAPAAVATELYDRPYRTTRSASGDWERLGSASRGIHMVLDAIYNEQFYIITELNEIVESRHRAIADAFEYAARRETVDSAQPGAATM